MIPTMFRNRKEVGIRIPDHPVLLELCRLLKAPIMVTSLSLDEGEDLEYLTTPELIDEKLGNDVDLVIDAGIGGTEYSTIIDCTQGDAEIIRQGKGEWEEA